MPSDANIVRLVRLAGKPRVHLVQGAGPEEDFESRSLCGIKPSPSGGPFWTPADGPPTTCPKCRRIGADMLEEVLKELARREGM